MDLRTWTDPRDQKSWMVSSTLRTGDFAPDPESGSRWQLHTVVAFYGPPDEEHTLESYRTVSRSLRPAAELSDEELMALLDHAQRRVFVW